MTDETISDDDDPENTDLLTSLEYSVCFSI